MISGDVRTRFVKKLPPSFRPNMIKQFRILANGLTDVQPVRKRFILIIIIGFITKFKIIYFGLGQRNIIIRRGFRCTQIQIYISDSNGPSEHSDRA